MNRTLAKDIRERFWKGGQAIVRLFFYGGGEGSISHPVEFRMLSAYPYPFNQRVALDFMLASPADVQLDVYDVLGRKIRTLLTVHASPGQNRVIWDARGMASGAYFVRLENGNTTDMRRIVLVK